MKNKIYLTILIIISLVVGFIIHRSIVAELLTTFVPGMSMYTWVHICAIFLESAFIFLVSVQVINKSINKSAMYMIWSCYFVVLAFGLFARQIGFNGMNLNPLAFIQGFKEDPQSIIVICMNIVFFIPMGYLFRNRKNFFSIAVILLILLSIETIQYIFKLGIFDVDDIIFNFIGFLIGYKIINKYLFSKIIKL